VKGNELKRIKLHACGMAGKEIIHMAEPIQGAVSVPTPYSLLVVRY
jgi:hypothetical protein